MLTVFINCSFSEINLIKLKIFFNDIVIKKFFSILDYNDKHLIKHELEHVSIQKLTDQSLNSIVDYVIICKNIIFSNVIFLNGTPFYYMRLI